MEKTKTSRGFSRVDFKDSYGHECSLQESSLATEECVWLGLNESKLTVFEDEGMGKYLVVEMPKHFEVNTRMHLSRKQVAALLPYLQAFVNSGEV